MSEAISGAVLEWSPDVAALIRATAPAHAMTAERAFAFSRRRSPEVLHLHLPSSKSEGAGKTGCLLHPRSRVRFAQTKLHTSIQGSGSIPAFPAQWLYGL